jgi:hypothetical protein
MKRCDEYSHATVHYMTLYTYSLLITIRAFPSEGRTAWVRRYCNLERDLMMKMKMKLFTTCTVCAGLQLVPYAPVVVSRPSQQCH